VPGRLTGKVCVVTGTGGSMGRATALAFAREGALVVGCDVTVEAAQETVAMVRAQGGEMVSLQPPCRVGHCCDAGPERAVCESMTVSKATASTTPRSARGGAGRSGPGRSCLRWRRDIGVGDGQFRHG